MPNDARVELNGSPQWGEINLPCGLPTTSIIIVNTNELHHLRLCLPTVFSQDYPDYEVIIVDNSSTDGSIEYIEQNYPQAKIIRNHANLGYAGANNVGFSHSTGEFIAVLNPDTQVEPGWLKEIAAALLANPQAGLGTPKILLMDSPEHINACGNEITFTGLTFCRGLNESASEFQVPEIVSAVSGAAFVIRKSLLDQIGGFDEQFFIYYEDTDLSLRAMLAGFYCIYVPTSVVYHQYAFRYSAKKCLYQERNRYISLMKIFRWPTLFVMTPTLLIGDFIAWGYSFLRGPEHIVSKYQTYVWLVQNWRLILLARRHTQELRRVQDRAILERFGYNLRFTQTTHPVWAHVLDILFNPVIFLISKIEKTIVAW